MRASCSSTGSVAFWARSTTSMSGNLALSVHEEFLNKAFAGQPTVSRPFASPRLLPDEQGALKTGLPMMYAAAPVRGESEQIIAVLGPRMRPQTEFTGI